MAVLWKCRHMLFITLYFIPEKQKITLHNIVNIAIKAQFLKIIKQGHSNYSGSLNYNFVPIAIYMNTVLYPKNNLYVGVNI